MSCNSLLDSLHHALDPVDKLMSTKLTSEGHVIAGKASAKSLCAVA
jgi:hypothetical protein